MVKRAAVVLCALFIVFAIALPTEAQLGQRGQRRGGQPNQEMMAELNEPSNFGGIVALIMSKSESDEWQSLSTEEAQHTFMESFWEIRDPTPGTPQNEFKRVYMQRVAVAMRMFRGENKPGWETDRGRVAIIYGLPKEQEMRRTSANGARGGNAAELSGTGGGNAGVGGGGGGGAGQPFNRPDLIWSYGDGAVAEMGRDDLRFSAGGGRGAPYILRTTIPLTQEAFQASLVPILVAMASQPAASGAPSGSRAAGVSPSPLPPEITALRDLVQGGLTSSELALQADFGFFPAPDQNTFTLIAFEVGYAGLDFGAESSENAAKEGLGEEPITEETATTGLVTLEGSGVADLKVFGALLRKADGQDQVVHQFNIPFTVEVAEGENEESTTRSFGATLSPGSYRLAWGVIDTRTAMKTTLDQTLRVPDFRSSELQMTKVMLGRGVERVDTPVSVSAVYKGIRLGSVLVDDDIDRNFDRNGNIEIFYVITGMQADSTTRKPKLEVTYRVLLDDGETSIGRLPTQTLEYSTVGQQIPLSQIRQIKGGESYQIEIVVKDLVSGTELKELIPFTIDAVTETS